MKKFLAICLLFGGMVLSSPALTPNERKMVQQIQAQVEEGQADYNAATAALSRADKNASDAAQHAAETDAKLGDAAKQIEALNKDNARMKSVYDACTAHWGLGAIWFGIKDLAKHLLITAIVILAVIVVLYALSFVFPWIGIALSVVTKFARIGISAVANVVLAIENHLKPKPSPPPAA